MRISFLQYVRLGISWVAVFVLGCTIGYFLCEMKKARGIKDLEEAAHICWVRWGEEWERRVDVEEKLRKFLPADEWWKQWEEWEKKKREIKWK